MKTLNAPGDLNIARVLRLVWQVRGISRVGIARELGIDKSTVTKIVSYLERVGLVREADQGSAGPQGGRKPISLKVVGSFGAAVGIEINPEGFLAAVVDLDGSIVASASGGFPPGQRFSLFDAFDAAIEKIAHILETLNTPVIGIGVALPAIVNADAGTVVRSIPLMIREEVDFCAWARKKYALPVHVENDARCGCIGEITARRGLGLENAAFLLAELRRIEADERSPKNLSVGFGFVLNGQPHYGTDCTAGEFRSVLWEDGDAGQFRESAASLSDKSGGDAILGELARHVALIVNLLNLDSVFIGGLGPELTERLVAATTREIGRKWPYTTAVRCAVTAATLGERAVAYGAAGHCLERFYSLPNLSKPSGTGPSLKEALSAIAEN